MTAMTTMANISSYTVIHLFGNVSDQTVPVSNGSSGNLSDEAMEIDIGNWNYYDIEYRTSTMFVKPHIILIFILVSISLAANICTILAISQVKSQWTSLFRFMLSLMMSDILITISVISHVVNRVYHPLYYVGEGPYDQRVTARCSSIVIEALNTMALNISLLNLMGMAIDHYVAILSPLRYYTILNVKTSTILICMLWIIAFLTGFSDFITPIFNLSKYNQYIDKNFNYCEFISMSKYHEEYTTFVIALICYIVMLNIYLKIYCSVKRKRRESVVLFDNNSHNRRKSSQESRKSFKSSKLRGGRRNTRALYTTMLILGSFMVCWLPMCCFQISMTIITKIQKKQLPDNYQSILVTTNNYLYVLLLVNTIFDPIIYAIRIGEVRQGFRTVLRKIFPFKVKKSFIPTYNIWKPKSSFTTEISSFSISEQTQLTNIATALDKTIKEEPAAQSSCLIEHE